MKPNQPQLPISNTPIDWTEPVAFKFNQLRAVSDAAQRAGFRIILLKVVAGGYEAHFQRETQPPALAAVGTLPDKTNAVASQPAHGAGVIRLNAIK